MQSIASKVGDALVEVPLCVTVKPPFLQVAEVEEVVSPMLSRRVDVVQPKRSFVMAVQWLLDVEEDVFWEGSQEFDQLWVLQRRVELASHIGGEVVPFILLKYTELLSENFIPFVERDGISLEISKELLRELVALSVHVVNLICQILCGFVLFSEALFI